MSKGSEDQSTLIGTPQITYWRYRHMQYTDFVLDRMPVVNNVANVNLTTSEQSFTLPRSGDLVNECFACFHLPGLANVIKMKATPTVTLSTEKEYSVTESFVLGRGNRANVAATGSEAKNVFLRRLNPTDIAEFNGGQQPFASIADTNKLFATNWSEQSNPYPGATICKDGTGATFRPSQQAEKQDTMTWVQANCGPDPFNMETYWDPDALRPNVRKSSVVGQSSLNLSRAYKRLLNRAGDPHEYVQFLKSGTADGTPLDTFKSLAFEMVESADESKRYHLAAVLNGEQALTIPGPQPYWCYSVGHSSSKP